jgi:hypothetical protein
MPIKTMEIEYYDDGVRICKGSANKFKIYKISIRAEPYSELTLNFMYMPTIDDVVEILSSDIYPTIAVGVDLGPWQEACIAKIKLVGLPQIRESFMTSWDRGITVEMLHAYIRA